MPPGRPRKSRPLNLRPRLQEDQPVHSRISNADQVDSIAEEHNHSTILMVSNCPIQEHIPSKDQPTTSARPTRAAKIRCLEKISDITASNQKDIKREICERNRHRRTIETEEDREKRLDDMRQQATHRRAAEHEVERLQRLEEMRQRATCSRAVETEEQQAERLEGMRQWATCSRAAETEVEHLERLINMQQRDADHRAAETDAERMQRLENMRQWDADRRAVETDAEHKQRLENMRQWNADCRAAETDLEHQQRLESMRQHATERRAAENTEEMAQRLRDMQHRARLSRAVETDEECEERLNNMRQSASQRLLNETSLRREQRLEEQRRRNARHQRAFQQNPIPTYKAAVNANILYQSFGDFNIACLHCEALHFPEERVSNHTGRDSFGDCCLHGRIKLDPPLFSNELACLFLKHHPLADQFHRRIRNLNACFALASINIQDDRTINSHGIYTFIANGQVYHKMNMAAQPTQNVDGEFERPQYGQMYFLDPEDAIIERINHPLNHGISGDVLELLERIIRAKNNFVQGFMMMREVEARVNQDAAREGIEPPRVQLLFKDPENVDERRYNVPSSNEVCAVITLNADQSIPENEMVVHQRGKDIIFMKNIDKRVEPFTYPLFYPNGTCGYSIDLKLHTPYVSRQHLTRLELAQYRLAFRSELAQHLPLQTDTTMPDLRETNFNALHFGGRLFQQYLVDTYIRVERDRIQWIKYNQKKILADQYEGVTHLINELARKKEATVSEKIILPSSFPGSTRYYAEHFEDAMALVRRLGSPDFFITVTSNPNWPEIKKSSCITLDDGTTVQQLTQDRPDLVARIAKLKFDNIIEDLDKKQIFGRVAAFVYTIEFQKRGLPHMHLLLIMSPEDKIHNPEELDDLISAEIPDDDKQLRELVLKWMIHNPCGELNPNATCMVTKKGRCKCRFDFPKSFQEITSLTNDAKPNYRRRYNSGLDPRNPEFSHQHAIYRKDSSGCRITRDNRHVAPYNGYLLKKNNCHINTEYVGSIRAVKYLYKYIYKGHDCASIKIVENQRQLIYNEADTFVDGRCITPPEACWRLFGNEIQKKSHSVQRLNIHLPGKYQIGNMEQAQEDLTDIGQKGSTLEAYFKHNKMLKQREENHRVDGNSEEVIYHYYWKMPEHFKWVGKTSEWVRRVRHLRVIGRIHNVNFIAQPELYHLRMLLYHVKNATSFEDLRTVNNFQHATYKQACLARGLAFDDKQWIEGLQESAMSKMPRVMRVLFTQILILASPENPKRLWDMFKEDLSEDFRRTGSSVEEAIKRAYRIIAHKLNTEATEGRKFRYWVEKFQFEDINLNVDEPIEDVLNADESTALGDDMYRMLRGKQIMIVDEILRAVAAGNNIQKCFFIDGPGGTGKTFIYKTLYYKLCGRNLNVQCMAFTGIASILLPEGRTSHRTFGLQVPLTAESNSNIKPGSAKAIVLAKVDVFLMDEAPMLPKYGLENMDKLLRKIGNANLPFGGKMMVLGGDFRQCLPVQPRANRTELLDLSIKRSVIWRCFKYFSLDKNMRVDPEQVEFANYLLNLGNGQLPMNSMEEIELPADILSRGNLIDEVFGNCLASENYEAMKDRAILAPLNKDVSKINAEIIEKLPGEWRLYHSVDSVKDETEGALQFTPEFLNSIDIADLPPHELKLKKNTIIMLLRNLDVSEGLCNGTRLIIIELCNNILKARIITGEQSGREVHIPRMTLDSSKGQLGCTMQRHQFPVRPAFATTVHKAQGQTFEFVGVDLRVPVFMHGMLYVAFSRVKRKNSLKVLLPPDNEHHTRNIVWKEVLL